MKNSNTENILELSVSELETLIDDLKALVPDYDDQVDEIKKEQQTTDNSINASYKVEDRRIANENLSDSEEEQQIIIYIIGLLIEYKDILESGDMKYDNKNISLNALSITLSQQRFEWSRKFKSEWVNVINNNSSTYETEYENTIDWLNKVIRNAEATKIGPFTSTADLDYVDSKKSAEINYANLIKSDGFIKDFNEYSVKYTNAIMDYLSDIKPLINTISDGVISLEELFENLDYDTISKSISTGEMLVDLYSEDADKIDMLLADGKLSDSDLEEINMMLEEANGNPARYEFLIFYLSKKANELDLSNTETYGQMQELIAAIQYCQDNNIDTVNGGEEVGESYYRVAFDSEGHIVLNSYIYSYSTEEHSTDIVLFGPYPKVSFKYFSNNEDIVENFYLSLTQEYNALRSKMKDDELVDSIIGISWLVFGISTGGYPLIQGAITALDVSIAVSDLLYGLYGLRDDDIQIEIEKYLTEYPDSSIYDVLNMLVRNGTITEDQKEELLLCLQHGEANKNAEFGIGGVVQSDEETGATKNVFFVSTQEMYEINIFINNMYLYLNGTGEQKQNAESFFSKYYINVEDNIYTILKSIYGPGNVEQAKALISKYTNEDYMDNGILNTDRIVRDYSTYLPLYGPICMDIRAGE